MTWILNVFRRILYWLRTFRCEECGVRTPYDKKKDWGVGSVCVPCYSKLWHSANKEMEDAEYQRELAKQRMQLKARRQALAEEEAEQGYRK